MSDDPGLAAARAARRKVQRLAEDLPGFCGTGIAREHGIYVVKVNLESEPAPDRTLPAEIDGVPVVLEVVGRIRAQPGD